MAAAESGSWRRQTSRNIGRSVAIIGDNRYQRHEKSGGVMKNRKYQW
jgi:hypothetical protein